MCAGSGCGFGGVAVPSEQPEVRIGGLHRIAYDRRPPASRMVQKATGDFPSPQLPHHQRVRVGDVERLEVVDEYQRSKKEDE